MNKILLTFTLLFSVCITSFAQTESKGDSLKIDLDRNVLLEYMPLEIEGKLETKKENTPLSAEELERRIAFVKNLEFTIPSFYTGPPTENVSLGRILPHTNDYAFYGQMPIGDDLYVNTIATHNTYLTIGASRNVDINLNYDATDWLTISGGVYMAKYNMINLSPEADFAIKHYNDLGFNAAFRLKLHDRIFLNGHGRYSINTHDRSRNLSPMTTGMFPQTYYGAGLEFKINDNLGVEGGVVREFNPSTRKWTNIPFLSPIFYSNGRKR